VQAKSAQEKVFTQLPLRHCESGIGKEHPLRGVLFMKSLKAQVYVEKTTGVETLTVEFNCWEQLYESIRAVQYAHPTDTAGLDRFLDIIPQDFPLFEWQIPWNRRSVNLPKPKPLTTQRSDRFASSYGR
jgi:hypothetical protein